MKKRLLAIALTLMLALTLLPTAAFATGEDGADLGTTGARCDKCKIFTTFKILEFIRSPIMEHDRVYHWVRAQCTVCTNVQRFSPVDALGKHSGGTETPTCTTGKTCDKCGEEYDILGHDWSAWVSKGDGKTHTRTCKRDGCDAVDTANCGGDGSATCVKLGTCTGCGQQYYGEHYFAKPYTYGYNENAHWHVCSYCEEGREALKEHIFVQGNVHLESAATCISLPVYYKNCGTCYYKGTETYVYQWGQLDPKNHEGGTEIKDAKAATCTEKGYTGDTYCKGCGVKLTDGKDIPATGHDWDSATCTTPKTCKVCKVTEGNALGHKGGTATCHTKAVCDVCKQAYGEVDADNHDGGTEIKGAKDATCTEKGYTGDTYCKGCNAKLTGGKDIPALGHDWADATCTTPKTCKVCKVTEGNALGHKGGTADCCHKAKCEVCKQEYGEFDPDNHSDLKYFPYKRPTTRAEGNIEYWYCSGCGKYYKDAEATKEITQKDTVIRKRRSTFGSSADDDKTVKSVKTGDAGIALYVGMAALSLTGGAWLRRKTK